jgi:steroid delta-isomerase-like uncharacterized protein
MERQESNKDTVRRLFTELDEHHFGVIDEVIAEDFVDHAAPPGTAKGREGVRSFYQSLYASFPDLKTTIHELIAENDKVVLRKSSKGTHTGPPFLGFAARGRPFTLHIINIFELDALGRIRKHWHGLDSADVARQLANQ